MKIPFLGIISAGEPGPPSDDPSLHRDRIDDLIPGIDAGDFFMIVNGDSMIEAGLEHGQYVLIRPGIIPRDGDICAVWVEGLGGTLKKVYFDNAIVRLVPANPDYPVIRVPAGQVRIQGVLVAALTVRDLRPR